MAQTTLYPSADTYIDEANPDTNYGTETTLHLKTQASNVRRSLVKFDIPVALYGAYVSAASLHWYVTTEKAYATDIVTYKLTSAFVVGTVTWNTKPTVDTATNYRTFSWASAGDVSGDIAPLVQIWCNSPSTNYGLQIRRTTVDSELSTQCSSADGANTPSLVITYQPRKGGIGIGNPFIF